MSALPWTEGDLTGIALCWRIERRDGVTIGLTAHDRDLWIDGLDYRAAPGMAPSAIRRSDALDADSMEVTGALSHDAIGERDLLAGRWDDAVVTVLACDWRDPAQYVVLARGTIGAIETGAEGFVAEMRGGAAVLEAPVAELTSPECRAELGDRRCGVAMAARRTLARVARAEGDRLTLDVDEPSPGGWSSGRLRWLGDENCGLEQAIDQSAGAALVLRQPPHFAVRPGTLVEVIEGCDKRLETCAGRFANAANFRGEPFLPGIDLLTRYPGA
ncbi:DUF2163 domain-containing protein [Sphingomonas sp.]